MAADITAYYSVVGLPEFYVMTLFHEIEKDSFYVGGKAEENAVRVVIEHIALHPRDPARRAWMCESFARLLAPHTTDRGLYCEFHIDETPRDLWRTDGLAPPPLGSEAHALWVRENRPVAYASPALGTSDSPRGGGWFEKE
ncbi:tautomerase family protein [Streptomyces sp. NPDC026672]|uniref:tautomerase family protein n=1 Tax=unclassified Streptomyces TaxID=2593676 RepID=UPI0033F0E7D7